MALPERRFGVLIGEGGRDISHAADNLLRHAIPRFMYARLCDGFRRPDLLADGLQDVGDGALLGEGRKEKWEPSKILTRNTVDGCPSRTRAEPVLRTLTRKDIGQILRVCGMLIRNGAGTTLA